MFNILFICIGNSARSILSEAIVNQYCGDRFRGFSAGIEPTGEVNPIVLDVLNQLGISAEGLHSKSLQAFSIPSAPHMDLVISVCERASMERCPGWSQYPQKVHWHLDRLSNHPNANSEQLVWDWFAQIRGRLSGLSEHQVESMPQNVLRELVHCTGQTIIDTAHIVNIKTHQE